MQLPLYISEVGLSLSSSPALSSYSYPRWPWCTQCPRRMCKQCCVLQPGCSLRSHRFDQLSSKQRGKLAVPAVPALAALNAITAHDPVAIFLEQEKHHTEAERVQNLQALQLEDDEEHQYQAAIAASLAAPHTTPHVISSASSSRGPLESFAPSAPSRSSFLPAHPSGFSMTPAVLLSRPSAKPVMAVRTIPYRAPAPKPGIKEHMSEDWMRPVVDNTKKPKRRNRINLDNTFSLIFWHAVCLALLFCVIYTNYFHRTERHRNDGQSMSVHFGPSGSCGMLSMSMRSLTFKPSFWSTSTHRAHSGSPAPPPIPTPSRRMVSSSSGI